MLICLTVCCVDEEIVDEKNNKYLNRFFVDHSQGSLQMFTVDVQMLRKNSNKLN